MYPYPRMGTVVLVNGNTASHSSGVKLRFKLDRYLDLAEAKGWTTQVEHARGTGLSQQTVSRMLDEDGLWKPSPEAIAALLAALNVDFHELFEVVRASAAIPTRRAS